MQMATLEQLNNMVQQLNKTTKINEPIAETKDVLSLPIVQKVIMAYEDELKNVKELSKCCKCKDYTSMFEQLLDRINLYHSNLQRVENKLDDLISSKMCSDQPTFDHSFVEDRNQM